MDSISYKTVSLNEKTVQKEWLLVDAADQTLGRFASKVAMLLRGKYKASFTPHVDCGDNVIVINAEKIRLTGNKMAQKEYVHYSGYPGGQKIEIAKDQNGKEYIMAQNSWGTDNPYQGTWYFTKAFVAMKTIDIMLHKDALPKEIAKKLGIATK